MWCVEYIGKYSNTSYIKTAID